MSKFEYPKRILYMCTGSKCSKRGGKDAYKMLKAYTKQQPAERSIELIKTECTDRCKFAPVCTLQPANIWLKEYHFNELLSLLEQKP